MLKKRKSIINLCCILCLLCFFSFCYTYKITAAVIYSIGTSDYILPESGSRQLSRSEILGMTAQELNYARNEIYARHGRKFQSVELSDYFHTKSWYQDLYDPEKFQNNWLSTIEQANVTLLYDRELELCPGSYVLDQPGYQNTWNTLTSIDIPEAVFANYSEYQAYAKLLTDGVYLSSSWDSQLSYPAEYYYLFDFNQDGREELLVWTIQDYDYLWKLFSCDDSGTVFLLAEKQLSVGNAGHSLEIVNGNCLLETASKGVVAYDADWVNYIYWEENTVQNFLYHWLCKHNTSADGEYLGTTESCSYTLNSTEISSSIGEAILSKCKYADSISLSEDAGNGISITAETIQKLNSFWNENEWEDAEEEEYDDGNGILYYVSNDHSEGIAVRTGPSTKADLICRLPYLTQFYVYDYDGNWAYVIYGDICGWMHLNYIDPVEEDSADSSWNENEWENEEADYDNGTLYYVSNDYSEGIAVRTEPSTKADLICRLPYLTQFYVCYCDGNWAYISYEDIYGWMHMDYMLPVEM